MIQYLRFLVLLCLMSGIWSSSQAQVIITNCGAQPIQNFDVLPQANNCGADFGWVDNTTIPGWYVLAGSGFRLVSDGNCVNGAVYSYGTNGNPDRALGSVCSGTSNPNIVGGRFRNNTGATITSITIRYTGEEWRRANINNTLSFEYSTNAVSLSTGTWTGVPALNFTTPQIGSNIALNGNLVGNFTNPSGTFAVAIPNGAEFWIRWTDVDDTGADAGMAIDNFSLTVQTTPATLAAAPVVSQTSTSVCQAPGTVTYAVQNLGATYNWTITPAGPVFTTPSNLATVGVDYSAAAPGNYTLRTFALNAGCSVNFTDQIITVFAPTIPGTLNANMTVCGDNPIGTLNLAGTTHAVVRWESSTDNFATITNIPNITYTHSFNVPVTTKFRVLVQNGACAQVYSNVITVTVDPSSNGGMLTSDASVCVGVNSHTMKVIGFTGTILRWESSTDNFFTVTPIVNLTSTLTVNNVPVTTSYRVVVKSGSCPAATSNMVTLTVNTPPVAGNIFLTQTICEANSVILSVTGHTGNVQWQEDPLCTGAFTDIAGETFDFLFTPPLMQTTCYRTVITAPGCGSVNTTPVTITVDPAPIAGNFNISSNSACLGQSVTLDLTSYLGTMQWQWDQGCIGNYVNLGNINQTPFNFTAPLGTHCLRALVASGVCPTVYSGVQTLIVSSPTNGGNVTQSATSVCSGTSVTLLLTGSQGTIQWQQDLNCTGTFVDIIGAGNIIYNTGPIAQTSCFRTMLTSTGCPTSYSNTVSVTVTPQTVPGTIAQGDFTLCAPFGPFTLDLTGYTGTILRWESSTDNFTTVTQIANTTPVLALNTLTQTTSYRVVVRSGTCATLTTPAITVSVGTTPVGGILTADHTVCEGVRPNTLLLTGYAGTISMWEASEDGFVTSTMIPININTYRPNVLTTSTAYRVRLDDPNCGTAFSNIVNVTVLAQPSGILLNDQTICNGSLGSMLVLNLMNGNIVRWEASNNNFQTYTVINNQNVTYDFGLLTQTTQFRVRLSNPGCVDRFSNTVTIKVQSPAMPGTLSVNGNVGNCVSNTGTLTLSGSVGTIVRWESSNDNFQTVFTISNFTTTYNYNVGGITQFRVVLQNAPCAIAYSNIVTVSPQVRVTGNAYLECNLKGKIVAIGSGGAPTYSFFITPNSGTQTSPGVFTNITPGRYVVTVRDRNNCSSTIALDIPLVFSAPQITGIQGVGDGQVVVNWNHVAPNPPAVRYQVQYRNVNLGTWMSFPQTSNNYQIITGLLNNIDYQVRVRVQCVARQQWSAWSLPMTFRAGGTREGQDAFQNTTILSPELSLFPNPNKGVFSLKVGQYDGQAIDAEIFDLTGKRIHTTPIHSEETTIELPEATTGVYMLRVKIGDQLFYSKFMVE